MIRLHHAVRIVAPLTLLAGVLLPAPAQAAPLCAYDSASHTLAVTAQLTLVDLATAGGYLTVNDTTCALLSDVDKVNVDLAGFANTVVIFDLTNGVFGSGFTNEGNGSSEIEFDVTGLSTGHAFNVIGSGGADGVTVGSRIDAGTGLVTQQVNLNSLADGATPDVDVVVRGAPGQMKLYGNAGDDVLRGGGTGTIGSRAYFNPMTLDAGNGADDVLGGSADDSLYIDVSLYDAGDRYAGGAATDSAHLSASVSGFLASSYISLDNNAADGVQCPTLIRCERDNYASDIERIFGSPLNDRLVGNDGPQTLYGGGGADTIDGAGGDDVVQGGPGPDVLVGGAGIDTVTYPTSGLGVSVNLNGVADDGASGEGDNIDASVENAIGTSRADEFLGNDTANRFDGGGGNDLFYGRAGDDQLYGRNGDDTFYGGLGNDLCAQGPGIGSKAGCEL